MVNKPKSIWDELQETWPVQMAKSMYQGAMLPGQAASGMLSVKPSVPGMWSDEDEARQQLTNQTAMNRVTDLAGLAMTGGMPVKSVGVTLNSGLRKPPPLIGGYHGTSAGTEFDRIKVMDKAKDIGAHMTVDPGVANIHASKYDLTDQVRNRIMPVVADVKSAWKFPGEDPTIWSDPSAVLNSLVSAADRGRPIPKGILKDIEKIEAQPGGWRKNFIPAMEEKGYDSIWYSHGSPRTIPQDWRYPGKPNSLMVFKDEQMLPRYSPETAELIKERGIKEPMTSMPWMQNLPPDVERNFEPWSLPRGIIKPYGDMVPGKDVAESMRAKWYEDLMKGLRLQEAAKAAKD